MEIEYDIKEPTDDELNEDIKELLWLGIRNIIYRNIDCFDGFPLNFTFTINHEDLAEVVEEVERQVQHDEESA